MKASEFDSKFEEDCDITALLDLSKARRPAVQAKRINVDFPIWMVESLDKEAKMLGVTRQSLIKLWLADKLTNKKATIG